MTHLVGRGDVLAALRRALDAAIAGRGQAVLVVGEAGIGKTAVATETAAAAAAGGARVLWASCWQGEGAPGYWPWVQVARELVGTSAAPSLRRLLSGPAGSLRDAPAAGGPPGAVRFQLFDELATEVLARAAARPLVIVLEDLQWADAPSLLLLDFLGRRLRAAPVLLLGTCRDSDLARGDPLAALLAKVAAGSLVLPLGPLDTGDVAALMTALLDREPAPALVAQVRRRTGGNPFFVEQVTRLLPASTLPLGAGDAIERRLAQLSEPCRDVLTIASVVGPWLPPALLAAVAGGPVAEVIDLLEEAARARVLARPELPLGAYRFTHDLFREAIYEGIGVLRRGHLHLEIGRELAAQREAGGEVALSDLASHFVLGAGAGGGEEALQWAALAAREATGRLAHDEAARHWRHALDVLEGSAEAGEGARVEVLLELGDAHRRAGAAAAGRAAYLRAAGLARRAADPHGLARAALGVHATGTRIDQPPHELVGLLAEAISALTPEAAPLRARVLASLARVLAWSGLDLPRAERLADEAAETARRAGDLAALGFCLLARHNVVWGPGNAGELAAEARLLRLTDLLELGDPAFHAEVARLAEDAERLGQPRFRYAALSRRAMQATMAGRFAEAEPLLEEAAALGREIGDQEAGNVRFEQLWALRSAQGRRAELLDAPFEWYQPDSVPRRWFQVVSLLERGDGAAAGLAAEPLLEHGPPPAPRNHAWVGGVTYGAELAVELGSEETRRALHELLLPFAGQTVVSGAAIAFRARCATTWACSRPPWAVRTRPGRSSSAPWPSTRPSARAPGRC